MASSLKSGPKTYLKVVEDSLRNEAEIKHGDDVEFVKQMEERGFDMENFVFVEYEDVAEPNTDPDHLNGNSEENVNTNPMSKMPTNSENQEFRRKINQDKKKRNKWNKAKKREAAKALAEVETKKIVDESAESLEKAAKKKALTEAIKAIVKSEEALIEAKKVIVKNNETLVNEWMVAREQAMALSCPLGNEATGVPHIMNPLSFSPTIWTCKHSDVFNGEVLGPVEVPKNSTEIMPQSQFPIVCGDWDVRDMRKMVADLVRDDGEEINDNLGDQFKKMLEVDDFNQEDYEFYEEVSDDTGIGESSKDNEVHSEGSDGSFCVVKRLLRRKGYHA